MPFVTVDNTRLFYRLEGKAGRPVLILSHSIGADQGMWAQQAADLQPYFQVLRYDTRGHGASDVTKGEYSIERLGRDVLGLADALGIAQFAFCGLSLGGATGQWLGLNAADRITRLVLANTSPKFGEKPFWEARKKAVLEGGMAAIEPLIVPRNFTPKTAARGEAFVESIKAVVLGTDPIGYAGCCAALRDVDFRDQLRKISVPTLAIAGDHDVSTPWDGHVEILAREIPGVRAIRLAAAHLSNLELAVFVHRGVTGFSSTSAGSFFGSARRGIRSSARGARRHARGPGHSRSQRTDERIPGPDHALRLGNDLDTARAGPANAPPARARHCRVTGAMGGIWLAPSDRLDA